MLYTSFWPTWRDIHKTGLERMFNRFKSLYQWPDSEEAKMYEGFLNILKNNFREIMRTARKRAAKLARGAGHVFPGKFDMSMRDYPPTWICPELWHELCDIWNSAAWSRKSETGSVNRSSMVDGSTSKHTGGSISMEQHRMKLAKENNWQQPSWDTVYCITHLKASSKSKLVSGEESIESQDLEFITPKCGNIFQAYQKAIKDKYGDEPTKYPLGDAGLWEQCAGGRKKGRVFGVGNSDPSFAVTGAPSCGSSSMVDYTLSQQQIRDLQDRLDESKARQQKERDEYEARQQKEREESETRHQRELEQLRKEREESEGRHQKEREESISRQETMEERMNELWSKVMESDGKKN